MQRLYPVLLAVSLALAVAIYLRPGLTKDFVDLASGLLRNLAPVAQAAFGANGTQGSPTSGVAGAAVQPLPPSSQPPWPTTQASVWGAPASEATVADRPSDLLLVPPSYQTYPATADPAPLATDPPATPWPQPPQAPPEIAPPPVQALPPDAGVAPPVEAAQPPPPESTDAMPPEAQLFERGQIVGRVGSEAILYSEIGMGVEEIRAQYKDRVPADELERQIFELLKERLKPRVETKLIYLDAKRTIPAENFRILEKRVGEHFEKNEVQNMLKRGKIETRQELEEKLAAMNTSLEQQKRVFAEQVIAHQWLSRQGKGDEEVPCADVLAHYQQHLADYERPARARWEQLMVRFSRFPGKAEAYQAIAEMGNQVLGGKDFAEVARSGSDGSTARNGGLRDWTSRASLVSKVLDEAVFGLPLGQLSPILEDEQGFHVVRVIEREEAHRISFRDAQVEIGRKIRDQRQREQEQAHLARLWKNTPVWTVFDGPLPYSQVTDRPGSPMR